VTIVSFPCVQRLYRSATQQRSAMLKSWGLERSAEGEGQNRLGADFCRLVVHRRSFCTLLPTPRHCSEGRTACRDGLLELAPLATSS